MTLRRPAVVQGLSAALAGKVPFPVSIGIDDEELGGFEDLGGGLAHAANIGSGRFTPTIDSGPENEWEGERDCVITYGVAGADRAARVARRDLMVPALVAILQADRTLGLDDPQVFAEIYEAIEEDDAVILDGTPISLATITVNILYVADSAAG